MKIKPIRNRQGYEVALRRVQFLWDFKDGSPEFDELDVLATLIEAIKFRLEQQGKDTRALIGLIGQRTRVYEVLQKKRALSLQMIRTLHDKLGIPANVLIQPTWGRGRAKRQSPRQT